MQLKFGSIALLGMMTAAPSLGAGVVSVPPASFLTYHVETVRDLSQEISLDSAVRRRLARHFHLSEEAITDYIHRNLVLSRLKTVGTYQVACVRADGTEYWRTERLAAGTPVFASRTTNRPILKLACGNPMVALLPPVIPKKPAGMPRLAQIWEQPPALLLSPDLKSGAALPALTFVAEDNSELIPEAALLPEVKTAGSFQSLTPGLSNIVPVLAGVAVLTAASGGSGNSGGGTPSSPTPVPEVSTAASLGMMLLIGFGGQVAFSYKRLTRKT